MLEAFPHHEVTSSPEQSVRQVQSFLHTIWDLPITDQRTHEARYNAVQGFTTTMSEAGFDTTAYLAILHGSLLWVTDAHSDADFRVIRLIDDENAEEQFSSVEAAMRKVNIEFGFGSRTVDEANLLEKDYAKDVGTLLMTPDAFVAGNTLKARELRLQALEQIADDPEKIDVLWDGNRYPAVPGRPGARGKIEIPLRTIRDWPRRAADEWDTKRPERYKKTVEEKLACDPTNTAWHEKMLHDFQTVGVPPFAVYLEALRQTNGALPFTRAA